ncbi:beta strand repeat-containing protein [Rariglobus hedericola]|uniref:PEP-CTERM sorting domain-containing protein n=1 Tax=Rariglobus hedericola TaxID=2597822 RepID=A0A556QRP3_9BACT|nr:PEP-CTERM sorting domain-containing protein [Rariglobus hedericola]TSJ79317.1 PEP-CTERM sorting domain-containing protein [Rariglobus hedericola]
MKSRPNRFLSAALVLLALIAPLKAATYTWTSATTGGAWDTTSSNWSGAGSTWVNGNDATFGFTTGTTVTLSSAITTTGITSNGTATLGIGAGSLIAPSFTFTNTGYIDLSSTLGGTGGLSISSSSTGRLNLKAAASYTGDTFLTGSAYLNLDGNPDNLLPTGTTVNMAAGTTVRLGKAAGNQQISGLVSTTANAGTVTITAAGYNLTLSTKSGTTTTFSGTISGNSTNTLNLVINGSGTQALNGTNSFYGTTTVSSGTLSLGSNLTNTGSISVSGGTLTSSIANVNLGTGGVSVSNGGTIDTRGSAIGSFTLAAGQDFMSNGGTLKFDLDTTSSLDQIKGSGAGSSFNLTNTSLTLNLISWNVGDYNNSYSLFSGFIDSGSVSGVTITGYDTTNWVASLSNTGVLSFSASAVPEPSTYAMLAGAAMLGFAALRRRRTIV